MASATTQYRRSGTEGVKGLKKIQMDAAEGFNFMSKEVKLLRQVPELEIPKSLREMLGPVDLNETGGVASIPEFGNLARPSTTGLEEGLGYFIHLNKRFNRSTLAKMASKGMAPDVVRELKYQSMKSVQAINKRVGQMFWGSSSGILCLTDTDITTATSQTLTLKDAYGITSLGTAAFLADMFAPADAAGNDGDYIAILTAGALIPGEAIAKVTSRSRSAGTITVTFNAAPTAITTNNLQIVFANALGDTIAETDYNKALVGMADALATTAVQGITHPNWEPAVYDTTSVRFSPVLFQKGLHEVDLRGGARINTLAWDAAVKRDATDNRLSAQRFDNGTTFLLDGDIKAKDVENFVSRAIPTSWVVGWDNKKAVKRVQISPMLSDDSAESPEGKEYIDRAGAVHEINLAMMLFWQNRLAVAGWTNKTRQ